MKKQTLSYGLIYGLCGGLLIALLRLVEYRYLVLERSIEIYGGLVLRKKKKPTDNSSANDARLAEAQASASN
jgi:hypothetical protein